MAGNDQPAPGRDDVGENAEADGQGKPVKVGAGETAQQGGAIDGPGDQAEQDD